jgi:hypothetical protein
VSILLEIADALTEALNAGPFSEPLKAARKVVPRWKLEDLDRLRTTVCPGPVEGAPIARAIASNEFQVSVGLQRKIDPAKDEDEEVGRVLTLADEVQLFVQSRKSLTLESGHKARFQTVEWVPVFVDHIDRFNALTSIVTVTYRVDREIEAA